MFDSLITEPTFYVIAIPAVIFLGLSKGGFSSVGIAATPLLALYLPPLEAAALLLPILLSQDMISVYVYRRAWDAWNLKVMLPGAALGMGAGWLLAAHISDDAIRILIGAIALSFIANAWLRSGHISDARIALSGVVWGTVSGFASFACQGGGPPYQVHMLPQHLPKMVFVGTTTMFFAAVNAMKILPYFMLGQFSAKNFSTSLALLPLAFLANAAGIWMVRRVPTPIFYRITCALLFLLGLLLLSQGLNHVLRG